MNRSSLFRQFAACLIALAVFAAAPVTAQLKVWEDYEVSDAVWSLTTINLEPGTQDIYLDGLKSTWVAANEVAKSLGHIEDYSIYVNQTGAGDAFDLLLAIKFPSTEMMGPSRELYNEIREIMGEYMVREITMK